MAARGRVLSVIARAGLQRLLTERGGGASLTAASTMRVPPTFTIKPTSPWSLRSLSSPLPAAAEQEEEQEESKPATPARAKPSSASFAAPAPLGRAPTAATAAFALLADDASRPAACTRVDLATKLLDADHAMSTPTYTREYLVR